MPHDVVASLHPLGLCVGLLMLATGCGSDEPAAAGPATPPAEATPAAAEDDSLLARACRHEAELRAADEGKAATPAALAQCRATAERMREDTEADDATFERFLQCRLDAKALGDTFACMSILAQGAGAQASAAMAGDQAKGDAALARLRPYVEAGVITADTLARIEQDRPNAGVGRFAIVLDDAHAVIESKRVAPGTTVDIHIHAGLGGDAPQPPPAGEAWADVVFTEASSGRRVARISPIAGAVLSIEPFAHRTEQLLLWWVEDRKGRAVELAIEPDPEAPTFAAPAGVTKLFPLLRPDGAVDRPVLLFPDGSSKSVRQWLGR